MDPTVTQAEQVAWAAGLFEGEGCISVMRQKLKRGGIGTSVHMHLGTSDHDIATRYHGIVGVGNITIRDRPGYKRLWIWQAAAIDDVRHVVRLLSPWLGERRLARAQEVLAEYEAAPERRYKRLRQGVNR